MLTEATPVLLFYRLSSNETGTTDDNNWPWEPCCRGLPYEAKSLHSGEEREYHVRVGVPNRKFWYTPQKLGSELNMRSPSLTVAAAALCIFVGVAAPQADAAPFAPLRVAQGAPP